ncbi:MAG: HPr(Ser) kinase/phosphatase [Oscillospiraceae bacterium]|nr:HPr(Ser) kinase/phosphatase [Oscillospiraceae bacterium]MDD7355248.1 HPr(Ser) kinase/phosphatase [Oscillospiraceae bacterium]MDY3937871.1 HPr(Ser) kinase/phosphatase [Oscillospiraceae bacterium]
MNKYSVSLEKVIKDNKLETLYTPKSPADIYITSKDINRPGLILAGYEDYFEPERIQIVGLSEIGYLTGLPILERQLVLERFFAKHPASVLISRNLEPVDDFMRLAQKYEVPILRSPDSTSNCMAMLIAYLSLELAERITRHGVLVEVSGEGVLIVGDSGVGKSETAIELIKRGHRLIADDAVEIRKASSKTLVGQAPDNIRHYIEVRGVGIINARQIFGMGAVKLTEKIDMVIQLEPWDSEKIYDRLGIEDDYITILDIKVPATVIPVKPGRNLAVIIETAAMNNRQKKMGYNAAKELMKSLGMDDFEPTVSEIENWSSN